MSLRSLKLAMDESNLTFISDNRTTGGAASSLEREPFFAASVAYVGSRAK